MRNLFLTFIFGSASINAQVAGNVGIGTTAPTNSLHIRGSGGTDPVRVEGLLPGPVTVPLMLDANGVLKSGSTSSVNITNIQSMGNITFTLTSGNTLEQFVDQSSPPTEESDTLNEFNGRTFTASQPGYYMIAYRVYFPQLTSDQYITRLKILKNTELGIDVGSTTEQEGNTIPLVESGGTLQSNIYSEIIAIHKLVAGDRLTFKARCADVTTGTTFTTNYRISIIRIR